MIRKISIILIALSFLTACAEGPSFESNNPNQDLNTFFGQPPSSPVQAEGVPPPPVNCGAFPTNFGISSESSAFGVCVSQPVLTAPPQEFPDGAPPFTVSGVVHGAPLADLQVRAQNVSDGVTVVYRTFSQITYDEATGNFSTTLNLPQPGLYNITVTATKFPELFQAQKTVSIFRITHPLISFVTPTNGEIVQSQEGIPLQVRVDNNNFVGNQLERHVFVNGVEQTDVFTGITGNIHNGVVSLLGGLNQLRVVFSNAAGTADATINVTNDVKGPKIQPIQLCEPYLYPNLGNGNSAVKLDLKITDDQGETPNVQGTINGDPTHPLNCILLDSAQHLYRCSGIMNKAGVNIFSIIAKDSRGNESEVATSCLLSHGVAAPYLSNETPNPKIAVRNGFSVAITDDLIQNQLIPALKNYLNSDRFKDDFAGILKQDMPVRGVFPISKGNSSIDIDPKKTTLGPFDISLSLDTSGKIVHLKANFGAWKGAAGMKTFHVKLFPNSSWPDLDEVCGHPIPLDKDGNELPFPSDPSRRLPDGDCVIDFSPDFAPNYCGHDLTSADPTEENRQCFIARIGTDVTHIEFLMDHFSLEIPLEIISNPVENTFMVNVDRTALEQSMQISPDTGFIYAHPAFTDPAIRVADIESIFRQSIVNMFTGSLPYKINKFLSRTQVLWNNDKLQVVADFPHSKMDFVDLTSNTKRAVLELATQVSGSNDFLNEFLADAHRRAADQGASLPIDPNGDVLNLASLGSPIFNHPIEVQPVDFRSTPERQLGLILKENLINQVLFALDLTGFLNLDYSKKFLTDNQITPPSVFEPKVRVMLGPGVRRSDGTLIGDDTPVILKIRAHRSFAPMLRVLSPEELPENSDLKSLTDLQGILELGLGELKLSLYESNDAGDTISQPGGDCSNTFSPLCRPIINMTAHALVYAGFKIVPSSETMAAQHGTLDPTQNPFALVLVLDKSASKMRVATVPGTNNDSTHSDRQLSRTLEQLLQAALTPKNFNDSTGEFEGGLSPLEIGIPGDLLNGDTVLFPGSAGGSDFTLGDLGIGRLGLLNPIVIGDGNKGEIKVLTSLLIQAATKKMSLALPMDSSFKKLSE